MSDTPPDDLQHLPTADAEADARAAKAALWKQIAEKKRQSRLAASPPVEPAPEPEPPAPEEPLPVPQRPSSRDEWDELFTMNPEEAAGAAMPSIPQAPASAAAPRKRSVIRRTTPLVVPGAEGPEVHQPAPVQDPAPAPEVAPAPRQRSVIQRSTPLVVPEVSESAPTNVPPEKPRAESKPAREEPAPSEKPGSSPKTRDKDKHKAESASSTKSKTEPTSDKPGDAKSPKDDASGDEKKPEGEPEKKSKKDLLIELGRKKWVQWGGASLSLSVGIHLLILGVGGFLVVSSAMREREIDFLPGGTKQGQAASQDLEHKIQQKKQPWLKKKVPLQKIAVANAISEIVLPDEVPDLLDLPSSSNMLSSKLGASGLGSGNGFGKGMGLGGKGGMVFQPLSMFGREIKAKKLALVLDVSSSMAPYLPRVIEELDKVARGSIVVLFPGCGLEPPPGGGLSGDDVYRTNSAEFERFWRSGGMSSLADARKFKFKAGDAIPSESIYMLLSKRPQTFFVHYVGVGYAWTALLSEQVRTADALYWFSDFQDDADFQQIEIVRENLLRRKQKLYIQPYTHGRAFDLVRSQLVEPTGGEVIEAQF